MIFHATKPVGVIDLATLTLYWKKSVNGYRIDMVPEKAFYNSYKSMS